MLTSRKMDSMNGNSTHKNLLPAMVIALGPFAQCLVQQTARIYLAPDPDRQQVTKFIGLGLNEKKRYDLLQLPLEAGVNAPLCFPKPGSSAERQAFIEQLVKSAGQIRASMGAIFHEIRAHEKLIKIGLDQRLEKPINLFILADLVDPMAAAALLPIAFLLQDISLSSPNTHSHLLLNAAIFPDKDDHDPQDEVALHAALQSLDQALRSVGDKTQKDLLDAMSIQNKTPLNIPVYLFDYRKPHYNDVAGPRELQTLLENSLLALMSGKLAETVAKNRPLELIEKQNAFYQSIGAAHLIYDPEPLIRACSALFARKVLTKGILMHASSPGASAAALADQAAQRLDTLPQWYAGLLSGTQRTTVLSEKGDPVVKDSLQGLTLNPVDFEKVSETPWLMDINAYTAHFEQSLLPEIKKHIQETIAQWQQERVRELFRFLHRQVENPALYPDGINTIRKVVNLLRENLANREEHLKRRNIALQSDLKSTNLTRRTEAIQRILDKAPRLPKWWPRLPLWIRKPLSVLANLRWIIRYQRRLNRLKNHIKEKLGQHHGAQVEVVLINALLKYAQSLHQALKTLLEELQAFENKLTKARSHLPLDWSAYSFPLGMEAIHWDKTFRLPAGNRPFAQWAYQKYQPEINGYTTQLIEKEALFQDWAEVDTEAFTQKLTGDCAKAFAPLRELSVGDVLKACRKLSEEMDGNPSKKHPNPVSNLVRAALPLMRPNFDALGGSGYSSARHFLQANLRYPAFIEPALQSDQILHFCQTDDPYTIAAVTIRDLMPLAAFTELNNTLQQAFERLNASQKKRLENVFVPIPKLEGNDLTTKDFRWKYKEETLQIELPISQNRFRHAQQESRLPQSDWVQYVLAESPELNYLAACFLNIFLQHPNWNSYEQTNAILAFAQQIVTYALDKDTTPQSEWPRAPIETLQEGKGDCEDSAILTAALMSRLGFQTALLLLPGHCALGIAGVKGLPGAYVTHETSNRRYFYAEATGEGWQIGVLPENYQKETVEVHPVERLIDR